MFCWRARWKNDRAFLEEWAKRAPFLASFGLTALFFAVMGLFFTPYYQENDDVFKLFFVKGVGTCASPSEFLGHSNILAGFLLSRLYGWCAKGPWYALYLAIPLFGGVWAMLAAFFISRRDLWVRLAFFLLFGVGCLSYFLFVYEFAITPQIAAQGALLLLAALVEREDGAFRLRGLSLASALMVAACVIRLDGLLLSCLLAFPWVLLKAWESRRHPWRRPFLGYFLLMLGLVAGLTLLSRSYYAADPGWKSFGEFNHRIEQLKDYRNPVFDERTRPVFEAVGWSRNDVWMFRDYCYVDRRLHTVENYGSIQPHFSHWTNQGKLGTVGSLWEMARDPRAMMALAFLAVGFLFLTRGRRTWALFQVAWMSALFLFLIYYLRCPQRLYLPCLTFVAALVIYEARSPRGHGGAVSSFRTGHGALWGVWLALCVGASILFGLNLRANHAQRVREATYRACVAELSPRKDQLYVVWDSSIPYEGVRAFDDFEIYRDFNIYPLAVFQRAPQCLAMLESFGIRENLFREMVGRKDILLICWPHEGYFYGTYMMEKFGMKIRAIPVKRTGCFNAYRIEAENSPARRDR